MASQIKAEVPCTAILCLTFNYRGFSGENPNTTLNSKQHKVQKYVHSDAVADISSSIFCFRFMCLLTQPVLVWDPVFPLLSQRTWAVISISQRRQGGWYTVIPCQNCHPSAKLMATKKLRERRIMMETGRWSSGTAGGRATVGAGQGDCCLSGFSWLTQISKSVWYIHRNTLNKKIYSNSHAHPILFISHSSDEHMLCHTACNS